MRKFEAEFIQIVLWLARTGKLPRRVATLDLVPELPFGELDLDSLQREVLALEIGDNYGIEVPVGFFREHLTLSDLAMRASVMAMHAPVGTQPSN
jgi:acyl carrier protein